jgi:hypothetical protein
MPDEGSRAVLVGHCPNCDADRNAEVLAESTVEKEHQPSGIWHRDTYSILRCLGCDVGYVRLLGLCSEDWSDDFDPNTGKHSMTLNERVTYWPSPPQPPSPVRRKRPDFLTKTRLTEDPLADPLLVSPDEFASEYPQLTSVLDEVYTAFNGGLHMLTAIGIRTVFDCAAQLLGSDPNQTFAEKLKELAAGNKISGEDKEILWVLTDAGSAAAHRGWKPSEENLNRLVDALENFLHRTFVLKHQLREVKKIIPARSGH